MNYLGTTYVFCLDDEGDEEIELFVVEVGGR